MKMRERENNGSCCYSSLTKTLCGSCFFSIPQNSSSSKTTSLIQPPVLIIFLSPALSLQIILRTVVLKLWISGPFSCSLKLLKESQRAFVFMSYTAALCHHHIELVWSRYGIRKLSCQASRVILFVFFVFLLL